MTSFTGDREIERQLGGKPEEVVELLDAADGDVRSLALRELIARKEHGLPALLAALDKGNEEVRALAAEALASLADPSTADAFTAAVKDKNEKVRSYAATGLANIGDPRAVDALIATLGDTEDVLHAPYTLSTYALARLGMSALPKVVPLLTARDNATRTRARYIVRRILEEAGMITANPELAELLDKYEPGGKGSERKVAASTLKAWLKAHPVGLGKKGESAEKDTPDVSSF